MKIRSALVGAIAALATVLAGCAGPSSSTEPASTAGSTASASTTNVRVGITTDPATLSPFAAVNLGLLNVWPTVYESLFAPETFGGAMKGVLAKDIKEIGTNKYRITLYDNITDTAGDKVTASDVKFSYEQAAASKNWPRTAMVKDITVVNDTTLEFTFTKVELTTLCDVMCEVMVVSQKAYEASSDKMATDPVGTTAYKLDNYTSGASLTFTNTGKYWQTAALTHPQSAHYPQQITFQIIQDPSQMAIALETGSIDVASSISTDQISRFTDDQGNATSGYTVSKLLSNVTWCLLFNGSDKSPLGSNKDLRQAILYAIDKKGLVDGVLGGKGEAASTFGGSVYGDFQKQWTTEDYYNLNLDKAKQLVTSSGFDTTKKLRIMTDSNAVATKTAQILQAELLQIGIQTEIDSYEEALFQTNLTDDSKWDIQINTKGSGGLLASLWQFVFDNTQYNGVTSNFVKDDKLQQLVEEVNGVKTNSPEAVNAFHEYLKDQAYGVGLFNSYTYAVGKSAYTTIPFYSKPFVLAGGIK